MAVHRAGNIVGRRFRSAQHWLVVVAAVPFSAHMSSIAATTLFHENVGRVQSGVRFCHVRSIPCTLIGYPLASVHFPFIDSPPCTHNHKYTKICCPLGEEHTQP